MPRTPQAEALCHPPPPQTKVTIVGKKRFTIGKIWSGPFWHTNFWVLNPPPLFPPSHASLATAVPMYDENNTGTTEGEHVLLQCTARVACPKLKRIRRETINASLRSQHLFRNIRWEREMSTSMELIDSLGSTQLLLTASNREDPGTHIAQVVVEDQIDAL